MKMWRFGLAQIHHVGIQSDFKETNQIAVGASNIFVKLLLFGK